MSLLGAHERMTARRAYEIGLVSQVVPDGELQATADWAADAIASASPLAVQGTLRAIWMAREVARAQALELASLYTRIGIDPAALHAGNKEFAQGRRVEWRPR
jgi:enoyl-CoA hydratase/carnithine racemase